MKFCNSCGHRMDDDEAFCTQCGSPAPTVGGNNNGIGGGRTGTGTGSICSAGSTGGAGSNNGNTVGNNTPIAAQPAPNQPAQGPTSSIPLPHGAPNPVVTAAGAAVTTAAKVHTKKTLIIIIASIVAAALVVTGVGFGTYKAQLWGGKTVPNPTDLGVVKSGKTDEFSASDVEKSLHKRGFKTVTKQTFSAKPKGSFLKYRGIESGKRYSTRSQPITVIASSGPGVPKGTSGQPVQNVTDSLKSMGVPVHYYKVITNTDKTKEGTVIASYPNDGQAVSDSKTGIDVGVATSGSGINYDVVGQDKSEAKQQYASKGFNVKLVPRFSSKKMLGKVVDSSPKPGSAATGGNLTLYYGIDANGMNDAVRFDPTNSDINMTGVNAGLAPVEGTYCTNDDKCITLSPGENSGDDGGRSWVKSSESNGDDSADGTGTGHALLFCHNGGDPGCPANTDPKKGAREELYYQNKGAFELMDSTISQITCGTDIIPRWDPEDTCVNGHLSHDYPSQNAPMSGASYEMKTHYVYFPVGSDVKGVIDSGYFDKDATAEAAKEKDVDTSRPFFIRRDKSLYKTTKVNVPTLDSPNPFVPEVEQPGHKMVATKPAPSDETAYYLVENPQLDWSSLPEFTISKDGSKADPKPTSKNATPDQITAAAEKGDFSLIAGKYCTDSGKCAQLDKTGIITGMPSDHPSNQLHLANSNETWGDQAHNSKLDSPYLSLIGPDSDYKCAAGTGSQLCYDSGASEAEIQKPLFTIYVFKNADTSGWYNPNTSTISSPLFDPAQGPATAAKTDRPYLYVVGYHMNSAPSDDSVYHLQE
ncbi:PASTA domain-containing protein [Bifidobacterium sp. ESL0775]|uniref:PASTA domain-containing protein n=1 Tax=Bifidobacterium sp. ESL0775 TaxID=2983230 RepID=UPI0023F68B70|nr:PASTA domain-containing protein [Bifidobacterium sp. ESL0775]WEV69451.1 PASTA domain-containing protein [Bifidobacterium sp. ESL0775]